MLLNNINITKDDFPHIHDWHWGHLEFEYSSKSIKLDVVSPCGTQKNEYTFFDVIHCEMSLGDPWGESPRIHYAVIDDEFDIESVFGKDIFEEKLLQSYIQVCFGGISGDIIKVVCRDLACLTRDLTEQEKGDNLETGDGSLSPCLG